MAQALLLFISDRESALSEIERFGGRVTQIFSATVLAATFPDAFDSSALKSSSESIVPEAAELTSLIAGAWKVQQTTVHDEPIVGWDDEDHQLPKNSKNDMMLAEQELLFPPTTSSYLRGSVAVGLVIVSGPTGELSFSNDEVINTLAQVFYALQCLATFEPLAKVTFRYEISVLSVNAISPGSCADYESCESIWRDPALNQLGCLPGLFGVNQYNKKLISLASSRWAYTAFITKYPLFHFAYAGSGRLVMQYSNDNWGPSRIDIVFAHETGHTFGAADEYKSACTCAPSGFYNIPNYNCEAGCSPMPMVSCLMKGNDLSNLCAWSRGQLGWPFSYYVLGQSTSAGPSLASFNGKLVCAFKAYDSGNGLLTMTSSDGSNWSPFTFTQQWTRSGPALAVFGGNLYCAFQANDWTNGLLMMSSTDGTSWGSSRYTGQTTRATPALAVFEGNLYCAFQANDWTHGLLVMSSTDGANWGNSGYTGQTTQAGPALAVFRGALYCAFQANDPGNGLMIMSSADGASWGKSSYKGQSTRSAPALAVCGGKLYCAFQANDAGNGILMISSADGINWGPSEWTGQSTQAGPSLAIFHDCLFFNFMASDSGRGIYITNTLGLV